MEPKALRERVAELEKQVARLQIQLDGLLRHWPYTQFKP
jgi:hypothetical protein